MSTGSRSDVHSGTLQCPLAPLISARCAWPLALNIGTRGPGASARRETGTGTPASSRSRPVYDVEEEQEVPEPKPVSHSHQRCATAAPELPGRTGRHRERQPCTSVPLYSALSSLTLLTTASGRRAPQRTPSAKCAYRAALLSLCVGWSHVKKGGWYGGFLSEKKVARVDAVIRHIGQHRVDMAPGTGRRPRASRCGESQHPFALCSSLLVYTTGCRFHCSPDTGTRALWDALRSIRIARTTTDTGTITGEVSGHEGTSLWETWMRSKHDVRDTTGAWRNDPSGAAAPARPARRLDAAGRWRTRRARGVPRRAGRAVRPVVALVVAHGWLMPWKCRAPQRQYR